MRMVTVDDLIFGADLTPPLRPIAAVLIDGAMQTHCSACFGSLNPFQEPLLGVGEVNMYCDSFCRDNDNCVRASADEVKFKFAVEEEPPSWWSDSACLRLALRLASFIEANSIFLPLKSFVDGDSPISEEFERVEGFGLVTNRKILFWENSGDDLDKLKEGVAIIARARGDGSSRLAEIALSLVLTNSVEISEKNGKIIGLGLYGTTYSWINHSCSPNSCYRFVLGKDNEEEEEEEQGELMMIAPEDDGDGFNGGGDGFNGGSYGPTLTVRSIKNLKKGDEVTIGCTDLLQPRETRMANLWSKYRFNCSCYRCAAGYVDSALRAFAVDDPMNARITRMIQKLKEGNSILFCQNVEEFLCSGDFTKLDEPGSSQHNKLHPLHCVGLEAYRALSAAYELQAASMDSVEEAMKKYKTSSAYSVLLAGIVYHFLEFEPSFVTVAEECWRKAGTRVLTFWNSYCAANTVGAIIELMLESKCADCVFLPDLDQNLDQKEKAKQYDALKSRLHSCVANTVSKVWVYLASESPFLTSVNDMAGDHDEFSDHARMENIVQIGLHCLRLAAVFSSICYGKSVDANYASSISAVKKAMGLEEY